LAARLLSVPNDGYNAVFGCGRFIGGCDRLHRVSNRQRRYFE
jgi:hypothetical protein